MGFWTATFELVFGRSGPSRPARPQPKDVSDRAAGRNEAPPAAPAPAPQPEPAPPEAAAPAPQPEPAPPEAAAPAPQPEPAPPEAAIPAPEPAPPPEPPPAPEAPPEPINEAPPPGADADDDEPAREPAGGRDLDEQPTDETVAPAQPPEPAPEPTAPAPLVWTDGWHPAIAEPRRLRSPNRRARGGVKVERVVVHITGTANFETARAAFMNPANQASAHYCIDRNGDLYQFVSEDDVAWHAGIHKSAEAVYAPRDGDWRKYKRYFSWHQKYPADAVFLDKQKQPCAREQAALVMRADGSPWPDYEYFNARWGEKPEPLGYETSKAVNQRTIGIETVGFGGSSPAAYTDAMYETLAKLVADICERHGIARRFGPVCGHEDVNPVERWGWDPGPGFDWSRVVEM